MSRSFATAATRQYWQYADTSKSWDNGIYHDLAVVLAKRGDDSFVSHAEALLRKD